MVDFIAILILVLIVGSAIRYIVVQKKKGVHCIGCPSSGGCSGACGGSSTANSSGHCTGNCSCGNHAEKH